ncbi:UNVERIFIED_ORG: phospholipid-binding lipoprotein MlaA [Zoogloea ramigera]|uniref:VacJ family lipoprotein n=1 Tax=Duganella zoogloeoides TaxID=75659 RepID=A0ABZ0XXZ3_9BURK|nr:VacJ family lipoprotein [Duganella zoogloeoides]WQH04619.1 VacJ family lipoprotein [Duganella zoogloeoides]
MKSNKTSLRTAALVLGTAMMLAGCAGPNPRDPYESYNRAMFTFNDKVDTYALKPVATVYRDVTPSFVQTGVGNFFGNISDAWSGVNNLLQGKGEDGMTDITRFALNSTLGILGLFDIATPAGLEKHKEDFGQTLGVWGLESGPYLVLPLLGPSTVRDTVALPADFAGNIWRYKDPTNVRNIGTGINLIDTRASLLDAGSLFEDAALDRYVFLRDGYLQRRESQVFPDGNPRKPKQNDDPYGEDDGAKPVTDPQAAPATPAPAAEPAPAPVSPPQADAAPAGTAETAAVASATAAATVAPVETSPTVSAESAPNALNSGTPAAN